MTKVKITNGSTKLRAFPVHGGSVDIEPGKSASVPLRAGWLTEQRYLDLKRAGVDIDLPKGHDIADFAKADAAREKAALEKAEAARKARDAEAEAALKAAQDKAKELKIMLPKGVDLAYIQAAILAHEHTVHLREIAIEKQIEGAEDMTLEQLREALPEEAKLIAG